MPVRKFRSVAEMEPTVWLEPNDPELWATIAAVWSISAMLNPPNFPPGVYKHRSIEDANRMTLAWEKVG